MSVPAGGGMFWQCSTCVFTGEMQALARSATLAVAGGGRTCKLPSYTQLCSHTVFIGTGSQSGLSQGWWSATLSLITIHIKEFFPISLQNKNFHELQRGIFLPNVHFSIEKLPAGCYPALSNVSVVVTMSNQFERLWKNPRVELSPKVILRM